MSDRARRIAGNEQRLRVFNDRVRDVREELRGDGAFACECGREACREEIEVGPADYERVRRDRRRFLVAPGHETPDVERVVERLAGCWVIQKTGEGADLVQ